MIFMERTSIGRRVVIHRSEGKFLRAREESIEGTVEKLAMENFPGRSVNEINPLANSGRQRKFNLVPRRNSLSPLLSIS